MEEGRFRQEVTSYQREKLCVSPEQTFYRRYYDEKEKKGKCKKGNAGKWREGYRTCGNISVGFICMREGHLAIISFSLLDECPPLPRTFAGVDKK